MVISLLSFSPDEIGLMANLVLIGLAIVAAAILIPLLLITFVFLRALRKQRMELKKIETQVIDPPGH